MAASLDRLARTDRLLVALDFDGTLSPLTSDPMSARMLPAARDAVDLLVAAPDTTVALVSGRSLGDLRTIAEHDDDSPILLEASHGAEAWIPGTGRVTRADDPAETELREVLQREAEGLVVHLAGVWIEPKTFGIGVHTRRASDADAQAAYRLVDPLVADRAGHWRRRSGSGIVEFSSRHEGKDTAIETLRARTGATAVLFAGDDVTDEDALRVLGDDDLGIRVGAGETAASITVPDVAALAVLLDGLARDRVARRGPSARQ